MKVTNWRRKLMASLVAGGVMVPSLCHAVNIPLGDPSFEDYVVPAIGFAYAAPPNGSYRPTSAWVDDLDSPPGYTQDNNASNWLYTAAYGESQTARKRPSPRTGNQAMHGFTYYNAQETGAVFEAEKTYIFSIWAQGDSDATGSTSRTFLYIFDGSRPFREADSLIFKRYAPDTGDFVNRTPADTPAQSQAKWTQITLKHTVSAGSPEVGKPVGVGFWVAEDGAVDDATLQFDDAANHVLVLEVNTTNGQVRLRNQTGALVNIDYYDVSSASGALNATAWSSLQEQNLSGFPSGNGTGNGWEQAGGSSSTGIGESYLHSNSAVVTNATIGLGSAFNVGGTRDLVFQYGSVSSTGPSPTGDYNNNGTVDAADFVAWRNALGQSISLPNDTTPGTVTTDDYNVWRANFGKTSGPSGPSTLVRGSVRYVTSGAAAAAPEPTSVLLVGIGFGSFVLVGRQKREAT